MLIAALLVLGLALAGVTWQLLREAAAAQRDELWFRYCYMHMSDFAADTLTELRGIATEGGDDIRLVAAIGEAEARWGDLLDYHTKCLSRLGITLSRIDKVLPTALSEFRDPRKQD